MATTCINSDEKSRVPKPIDNDISNQQEEPPESSIQPLAKEKSNLKTHSDAVVDDDNDDDKRETIIWNFQYGGVHEISLDYHFNCGGYNNPRDLKNFHKEYLYHTRRAIKEYNNVNKDATIKLVKVVRANCLVTSPIDYYITFEAKDASGRIRTYQALVGCAVQREKSVTRLVRRKPGCN